MAAVVLVAVGACCFGVARVGAIPAPVTITIKSSCVSTINCESFNFSLKNGGTAALNGLTIQIAAPNTITAFSIGGQPAAKPTGVQNAWSVFPATIPVGATVTGSGTVSAPLTKNVDFKIFTTPDGFATATGQDVPLWNDVQKVGQAYLAKYGDVSATLFQGYMFDSFVADFVSARGKDAGVGHYWIDYNPALWDEFGSKGKPVGGITETFNGTVTGPATVSIAIEEKVGANRCRWMVDKKADFHPGICTAPVFLPADVGSKKWKYEILRPLPPGHYTLESRATSGGVSGTDFSAAQHNLVQLDVALHGK